MKRQAGYPAKQIHIPKRGRYYLRRLLLPIVISCLLIFSCGGGGGGGGDTVTDLPGPFTVTFSLDATFQVPHGDQPISIAVVRLLDGMAVAEGSGIVSATQNPSFSYAAGAVMDRGTAYAVHYWIDSNIGDGTIGVCDPIAIDHQWSVEFLSPTNDVDFTVSYEPALTEDVCGTFT